MMSPRPMSRGIKPVLRKVGELSLSSGQKITQTQNFLFFYCIKFFFFTSPPVFQVGGGKPLGHIVIKMFLGGVGSPPSY